jgi:hypothetical protein
MLYSTGLVAGGALTGVLIAALQGIPKETGDGTVSVANWILDSVGIHGWEHLGPVANFIGIAAFAVLCWSLVRAARQKLDI